MRKITRSVINLSELPKNLQSNKIFNGHKLYTYAEFHIDDYDADDLSLWLIETYPTIKRKASFLIKIDKEQKTWYNEEQTDERINIIGQNGNDGTHY